MELTDQQKQEVTSKFLSVQNVEDFVVLLNYLVDIENQALEKDKKRYFEFSTLNYYLYKKQNRYFTFEIPKKSGGVRTIKSPDRYLKAIQRKINFCLQLVYTPKPSATGFVPGRSIVTNASFHVNKKYVYNIDLKDFFPNTNFGRIHAVLQLPPFSFNKEVAYIIAKFCTDKGSLPQGAPASPVLTNLVCQRLDRKLYQIAKSGSFSYSRYADDITFSSDNNIFNHTLTSVIKRIISEEGYQVNDKKERLQTHKERQEVTGIIVNEKTNVDREYIKKIRASLHCWQTKGYKAASDTFAYFYIHSKGFSRNKGKIPPFERVLSGQIEYMGMVRGKEDKYYIEFKNRLIALNTLLLNG